MTTNRPDRATLLSNMQRPIGVTVTASLMAVNLFADIILSLTSPTVVPSTSLSNGPVFTPIVIAVHIALVGLLLGQCIVLLYYWFGRSWARWFVLAGCIFYITGLREIMARWRQHHSVPSVALTLGSAILAIYLLWYLHTRDVRDWFARSTVADVTNK